MAIHRTCDGCGVLLTSGFHARGMVKKMEYCSGCAETVDEYLENLDRLHDQVSAHFQSERIDVRRAATEKMGENAKLPDTLNA